MIVAVMPEDGDRLEPIIMKINGKNNIYFYRPDTGQVYSFHLRLKEINPSSSIEQKPIDDKIIAIGTLNK